MEELENPEARSARIALCRAKWAAAFREIAIYPLMELTSRFYDRN